MRRRGLLFVGQAPGANTDPERPLDGASGRLLARLFGHEHVRDFADAVNLIEAFPGKCSAKGDRFPIREARRNAEALAALFEDYRVVVVLGRGPARVFDLAWFEWERRRGADLSAMPHTSGVNHWWNDPANKAMADRFVRVVTARAGLT